MRSTALRYAAFTLILAAAPLSARAQSQSDPASDSMVEAMPADGGALTARTIAGLPSSPEAPAPPSAGAAASAQAQSPAPSITMPQLPRLKADWDGFDVRNASGTRTFRLTAELKEDGRFTPGEQPVPASVSPLLLRYGRITGGGTLAKYLNYRATFGYSGGPFFNNGFIEIPFSKMFRVRVGRDKPEVGYEQMEPDGGVLFLERALPSSMTPGYDDGIQGIGEVSHGAVRYAVGVFRGLVDGSNALSDSNATLKASTDLTGRILLRPFVAEKESALAGLGVGVGVTSGRQDGPALPSFKTSIQDKFFGYSANAAADGTRTRVTPQLFYDYKNAGVFAEYMRSEQPVTNGVARADVVNQAWQVAGYVTLTGETGSIITPKRLFDPAQRSWGALQLVARYSVLEIDPDVFALGLAKTTWARQANQTTVGFTWYVAEQVKVRLNYERVTFGGARPAQNALLYRLQFDY